MSNQINKSIMARDAKDLLEDAKVYLEALESSVLRVFVSYDQSDLSDIKTKALISVCEILASGALENIESGSAKTKLDLSAYIDQAHGILVMLGELSDFGLSRGHTAAALNGLTLVAKHLNESLDVAVDAVMDERGSHNA